jgi:hypothetical protein
LNNLFANVFVIVFVVCKFLVMKAEHTVASYIMAAILQMKMQLCKHFCFFASYVSCPTKKNIFRIGLVGAKRP